MENIRNKCQPKYVQLTSKHLTAQITRVIAKGLIRQTSESEESGRGSAEEELMKKVKWKLSKMKDYQQKFALTPSPHKPPQKRQKINLRRTLRPKKHQNQTKLDWIIN